MITLDGSSFLLAGINMLEKYLKKGELITGSVRVYVAESLCSSLPS